MRTAAWFGPEEMSRQTHSKERPWEEGGREQFRRSVPGCARQAEEVSEGRMVNCVGEVSARVRQSGPWLLLGAGRRRGGGLGLG